LLTFDAEPTEAVESALTTPTPDGNGNRDRRRARTEGIGNGIADTTQDFAQLVTQTPTEALAPAALVFGLEERHGKTPSNS